MGIATVPAASAAAVPLGPAAASPSPRLVKAAHEFEAQMMKELMEPLHSGSALPGSGDEDGGADGALQDFASEALGRALSEGGGLGIASRIVHQLSPPAGHNGTLPVIGNSPVNTVMKKQK